jgi:hypothetical protein
VKGHAPHRRVLIRVTHYSSGAGRGGQVLCNRP